MGGNSAFLSSFWHLHFRGNLGGAREGAKPKKQLILSQSPTFLLRHMTRRHDDDVGEGGRGTEGGSPRPHAPSSPPARRGDKSVRRVRKNPFVSKHAQREIPPSVRPPSVIVTEFQIGAKRDKTKEVSYASDCGLAASLAFDYIHVVVVACMQTSPPRR